MHLTMPYALCSLLYAPRSLLHFPNPNIAKTNRLAWVIMILQTNRTWTMRLVFGQARIGRVPPNLRMVLNNHPVVDHGHIGWHN